MRKYLILLCSILFIGHGVAYACESNQIDINGDGTQCVNGKFAIKTTNLNSDDEFKFTMTAQGIFTVDCGADGTLTSSANDITDGNTITRSNTTIATYTCTYSTGGVKTIAFDGLATNYSTDASIAAISFYQSTNNSAKKIKSIHGNLSAIFPTIGTSDANPRFRDTFQSATNLEEIPTELFCNYKVGTPRMFYETFNRSGLKSIPSNLFSNITNAKPYAFHGTFYLCDGLTSIPAGLFGNITSAHEGAFSYTFYGCSGIKSIPPELFRGIKSRANILFMKTFGSCSGLSGYIPPSTFAGLIANGSPTMTDMWRSAFDNTQLVTSCPSGTTQFITGYESYWGGKVSCVDENLVCEMGEYLPAHWFQCEQCPENNYCPGGTYTYNGNSQGATQCPTGLFAPNGMWEAAQCGRILHVGDGFVYLRATKKTAPSLHLDLDHDGVADYFGNMTTLDVPMSRDTQRKLKVRYDNTTYSIYDDSVELPTE